MCPACCVCGVHVLSMSESCLLSCRTSFLWNNPETVCETGRLFISFFSMWSSLSCPILFCSGVPSFPVPSVSSVLSVLSVRAYRFLSFHFLSFSASSNCSIPLLSSHQPYASLSALSFCPRFCLFTCLLPGLKDFVHPWKPSLETCFFFFFKASIVLHISYFVAM